MNRWAELLEWLEKQAAYWENERFDEARRGNQWYEAIAEGRVLAYDDVLEQIRQVYLFDQKDHFSDERK